MQDESEFIAIKAICDAFGCGNVMEWASAIWRYELAKKGFPPSHASICVTSVICDNPNDKGIRIGEETRKLYDSWLEHFMTGKE